jgi:uncharacterized protein YyaL (SSP411 family)
VLAGEADALRPMREVVHGRFLPFHTILWSGSTGLNPELQKMNSIDGNPAAYVCENFTCHLPATEPLQLGALLQ